MSNPQTTFPLPAGEVLVAAEAVGTGLLVAVVVAPGIQVAELMHAVGVLLLANLLAGVFGSGAPTVLLGPLPACTTTLPSAS